MKKTIASLCILLLCALCLPMLAACGNGSGGGTTTEAPAGSTPGDSTVSTEKLYDSDGYWIGTLPDELDYRQAEVNIIHWSDSTYEEFQAEGDTAELIPDSIYKRNSNTEKNLNVKLKFTGIKGNNSNRNAFITAVENSISTGDGTYDAIAAYSMCAASLAVDGFTIDLAGTPYVDLDNPWWPERLVNEAMVDGKLYFASGDISTNMLWAMLLMIYNKDLLRTIGRTDDLADKVEAGTWTYEELKTLCADVYSDIDGVTGKTAGDRYGFATSNVYCDALYYGAGLRVVERDASGNLAMSESFGSEKTHNYVNDLLSFFDGQNAYFNTVDFSKVTYFAQGNSLFELRPAFYIRGSVTDTSMNYGVLPVPKYDTNQQSYVTTLGFTYTMYAIPKDAKNTDMSSALLECLASEAYRNTTPAIFELCLKLRYATNSEAGSMFDTIRENVSFDLGRIFCLNFNSGTKYATYNLFRYALVNKNGDWMSTYATELPILNGDLKALTDAFAKIGS